MSNLMETARISDITGFKIGHAQDFDAATGCTVILCERGAVTGVDVRGGSPGTRDTDALNPVNLRQSVHAVILSGGSSFGLDAAGGVMQYLEERGVGRDVKVMKVPNVCGAILFDLLCGDYKIRPDKQMGYEACLNASDMPCGEGSVGAGTGATVGKINGMEYAMKGGIGTACFKTGELLVGAVVAVNCVGDIYDTGLNTLIAGVLNEKKDGVLSTEDIKLERYTDRTDFFSGNTVLGAVLTNARLTKPEVSKLASVSHDGIARAVRPSHSVYDGDTIFAMAAGDVGSNFDAVAILAVRAVEAAILSAVKTARPLAGFTTFRELNGDR